MQINAAVKKDTRAIEGIVQKSKRRNGISLKYLAVEKRNSRISLFMFPSTDYQFIKKFMEKEQLSVLVEIWINFDKASVSN